MKKILGLLIVCLMLSNCAPSEKSINETRIKYNRQSPYELCMNYLSLPDWNQWQAYRAEAIEKRGIDCSPWYEEGYALKQKMSDELFESGKKAFNSTVDAAYGVTPESQKGKKLVCTTQRIGTSGMAKTTCREK
jgi:hypothetical protein